jgi:uncharacterized integral membrane protein
MMIYWLFALILALFVAVFATFNQAALNLYFFDWVLYQVPISVVIIVSAFVGALVAFLVTGIKHLSSDHSASREHKRVSTDLNEALNREEALSAENRNLKLAYDESMREKEAAEAENDRLLAAVEEKNRMIYDLEDAVGSINQESTLREVKVTAVEPEPLEPSDAYGSEHSDVRK